MAAAVCSALCIIDVIQQTGCAPLNDTWSSTSPDTGLICKQASLLPAMGCGGSKLPQHLCA